MGYELSVRGTKFPGKRINNFTAVSKYISEIYSISNGMIFNNQENNPPEVFMNKLRVMVIICVAILTAMQANAAGAQAEPEARRRYDIRVELDHEKRMLKGVEIIDYVNTAGEPLTEIQLHLYWNAFKNNRSAMNQELWEEGYSGFRFTEGLKEGEWGWMEVERVGIRGGEDLTAGKRYLTTDFPVREEDQTVLALPLPKPLLPGETIPLEIEFTAKIPRTQARSGYYQDSYFFGQWYPKPGVYETGKGWNCHQYHWVGEFYADFADFTVQMTLPKAFVVGSSGGETEKREDVKKGTITHTYFQENVHDFAWTAKPDYIKLERDFIAHREVTPAEYSEMAARLQLPLEQVKLSDVRMILLLNPEHKGQEDRHFKALSHAIKYYGLWYGAYPYKTMTLVDPPFRNDCGGMEYPTLITGGSQMFPIDTAGVPEGVIVHEYGHNYWYGLSANNEFEEAWLDEGINSYSDAKVMEKAYGEMEMPLNLAGIPLNRYLTFFRGYSWLLARIAAISIVGSDKILTPSWRFSSGGSYGMNVYMRAEILLFTLERILGEDVMLRVMRGFQTQYRYLHPRTEDFIRVVNEVSGRDMNWFFQEFFYQDKSFDYAVSSVESLEIPEARGVFDKAGKKTELRAGDDRNGSGEKNRRYLNRVKVRRLGDARIGGDVVMDIRVVFEDGSVEKCTWDGQERWTEFRFVKPVKIRHAELDPHIRFLIDANITNNSLKRESATAPALRWSVRIQFWLQNILQIVGAVS